MSFLVAIGVLFLVVWLVAWLAFHVVSGAVHVLLLIGAAMLIWGLLKRARAAV